MRAFRSRAAAAQGGAAEPALGRRELRDARRLLPLGVGHDVLGLYPFGQVEGWIPIFLFAMLFGLSMDYEVFLVTRMREAWDEGDDNETAVAHGLERTGRIITAAAVIMCAAFSGLPRGPHRRPAGVRPRARRGDLRRRDDRALAARPEPDGGARPLELVAAAVVARLVRVSSVRGWADAPGMEIIRPHWSSSTFLLYAGALDGPRGSRGPRWGTSRASTATRRSLAWALLALRRPPRRRAARSGGPPTRIAAGVFAVAARRARSSCFVATLWKWFGWLDTGIGRLAVRGLSTSGFLSLELITRRRQPSWSLRAVPVPAASSTSSSRLRRLVRRRSSCPDGGNWSALS